MIKKAAVSPTYTMQQLQPLLLGMFVQQIPVTGRWQDLTTGRFLSNVERGLLELSIRRENTIRAIVRRSRERSFEQAEELLDAFAEQEPFMTDEEREDWKRTLFSP